MSLEQTVHLSLTYDAEGAHRIPPVAETDWGYQAAKVDDNLGPDTTIYLNRVGTFGISTAGMRWARLMAAIQRGSFYACGHIIPTWHEVYSDDGVVTGMGKNAHLGPLAVLAYLVLMQVPIKWSKVGGGIRFEWTGYAFDVGRFEIGIAAKRAVWVASFCQGIVESGSVVIRRLREGLGRLGFVSGPLEHIRPFLAPIYAWVAAAPVDKCLKIPLMVRLVLLVIKRLVLARHMRPCRPLLLDFGEELLRVDAKAEGLNVVLGGWRSQGGGSTKSAKWFGVTLTKENAAWVFERGEPFRVIASLELLAILVGIMVLLDPAEVGKAG